MTFSSGIGRLRLSALGAVRNPREKNCSVVVVARGCAHAMQSMFNPHKTAKMSLGRSLTYMPVVEIGVFNLQNTHFVNIGRFGRILV